MEAQLWGKVLPLKNTRVRRGFVCVWIFFVSQDSLGQTAAKLVSCNVNLGYPPIELPRQCGLTSASCLWLLDWYAGNINKPYWAVCFRSPFKKSTFSRLKWPKPTQRKGFLSVFLLGFLQIHPTMSTNSTTTKTGRTAAEFSVASRVECWLFCCEVLPGSG